MIIFYLKREYFPGYYIFPFVIDSPFVVTEKITAKEANERGWWDGVLIK